MEIVKGEPVPIPSKVRIQVPACGCRSLRIRSILEANNSTIWIQLLGNNLVEGA